MPRKTLAVAAVALASLAAVLFVLLPWDGEGVRPPHRADTILLRDPAEPIGLSWRAPSSGLAWSRARYPVQYEAANLKRATLRGLADTDDEERFLDVSGRAYSRVILAGFSYTGEHGSSPEVVVDYLRRAETFVGKLTATGLKPNFAYQLKLVGHYADDPVGFEQIGYLGRWRLPGRATNVADADYEAYPEKEKATAYLFFDFFVTDAQGRAEHWFYADSSLHVLWNASVQRTPSAVDGAQTPVFRRGSDAAIYANPRVDLRVQRIYAESEQHAQGERDHRPPIGRALLPPHRYVADLVLTEESFHGWGDGGSWATVMAGPVAFEVSDKPTPPPDAAPEGVSARPLSLRTAGCANLDVISRSAAELQATATTANPQVALAEELSCEGEGRWVLAFEVYARGKHRWELFVAWPGEPFDGRPVAAMTTRGDDGWQRFEVDVTSLAAGRRVRFRIDPAVAPGLVGVRNVELRRLIH
jgi:hypothetical protein